MIYILQHRDRRQEGALLRKRQPWRSGIPPATSIYDCCSVCWSWRFCPPLLTFARMAHIALGESLGEISRRRASVKYQSGVKAVGIFRHVIPSIRFCVNGQLGREKNSGLPESHGSSTAGTKATCNSKKCEIFWNLLLSLKYLRYILYKLRIQVECHRFVRNMASSILVLIEVFGFVLVFGRYSIRLRSWAL